VFGPSYTDTRLVGGREKSFRKPLFPGYLFCSFDPYCRLPVLTVPGVISILGVGNSPTPVEPHEIDAIRRTVASGLPVEPFRLVQPGEPVRVKHGPLSGIEGVVVNYKGKCRLVITVKPLNDRSISVELDRSAIVPLERSPIVACPQATGRLDLATKLPPRSSAPVLQLPLTGAGRQS
jgi:transcription termination/antitermination protein NusG